MSGILGLTCGSACEAIILARPVPRRRSSHSGGCRESIVTQFRRFRNTDPPALADVWNESHTARGAYPLRTPALLERWVFSKSYFDHDGLIVAVENDRPRPGYALAGFAPTEDFSSLSFAEGVICSVAVRPADRRKGVGAALVERCEEYLIKKGTRTLRAGPVWPQCPFGFGLYGGTNCPGFLASDPDADPFFRSLGYTPASQTLRLSTQARPAAHGGRRPVRHAPPPLRSAGPSRGRRRLLVARQRLGHARTGRIPDGGQAGEQHSVCPRRGVGTRRLRLALGLSLGRHPRHRRSRRTFAARGSPSFSSRKSFASCRTNSSASASCRRKQTAPRLLPCASRWVWNKWMSARVT